MFIFPVKNGWFMIKKCLSPMSFQKNTGHYIQQNHDYILPNLLFIIQSILV